jgi:hypothetical protein
VVIINKSEDSPEFKHEQLQLGFGGQNRRATWDHCSRVCERNRKRLNHATILERPSLLTNTISEFMLFPLDCFHWTNLTLGGFVGNKQAMIISPGNKMTIVVTFCSHWWFAALFHRGFCKSG